MKNKLYCYVDETGQHTLGRLFIVSVILTGPERDDLLLACAAIEARTGKHTKWIKTTYELRAAYIQETLNNPLFHGRLNFAIFERTVDYAGATAQAIAKAIRASGVADYKASVMIDGLTRNQEKTTALSLRRAGIRLRKLRGARDESDALIRLADAICGLVGAALEEQTIMRALFDRGVESGFLKDVTRE